MLPVYTCILKCFARNANEFNIRNSKTLFIYFLITELLVQMPSHLISYGKIYWKRQNKIKKKRAFLVKISV